MAIITEGLTKTYARGARDGPFEADAFDRLPGFTDLTVTGQTVRGRLAGRADELVKAAGRHTVVDLLCEEPSLEEVFLSQAR